MSVIAVDGLAAAARLASRVACAACAGRLMAGALNLYLLAVPGVVTVMLTPPAAWAGAVAVSLVADTTVKRVAADLPNLTAVAPVRALPVIVTTVPPVAGPEVGVTLVSAGMAR